STISIAGSSPSFGPSASSVMMCVRSLADMYESDCREPVTQQLDTGVTGLLGMELRRAKRTVLDGSDEAFSVFGPRHDRTCTGAAALKCPLGGRIAVHEIETFLFDSLKKPRTVSGTHGAPAHMRKHLGAQFSNGPRPLTESRCLNSTLDAGFEHDLFTHAYPHDRPPTRETAVDEFIAANRAQLLHHCVKCPDAWDQQSV